MATGVDLSDLDIDVAGWAQEQAEAERALLKLAQADLGREDDRDYLAAMELLFKYVERDPFYAPDVLVAIERGARMIARRVLDEGRPNISPLMYFGKPGEGGRKTGDTNLARLQRRIAVGLHLSAADAKNALTMERGEGRRGKGNRVPKEDWPETLGEVETYLVDYVLTRLLGGKSSAKAEGGEVGSDDLAREHKPDRLRVATEEELELARGYVRESFAWLPWNDPEATVTYPPSW